ncbi:MAG: DUF4116 domain-containing protein [Treponema sp.]|jgi:hypothetical protein|nr:DUF4116 domain-containing protein [Treponema sp.]
MKTAELCLEAVRQDGWALKYTPEALKTAELCLAAALKFVPEAFRGEMRAALEKDAS